MFKKYLSSIIAACALAPDASAGVINGLYNYQDYLDFGTNRGRFAPQANVQIAPAASAAPGLQAPSTASLVMPDFASANGLRVSGSLIRAETAAIGSNYLITANHMIRKEESGHGKLIQSGARVDFAGQEVAIIDSSRSFEDYGEGIDSSYSDFAVLKTDKIPLVPAAKLSNMHIYNNHNLTPENKKAFMANSPYKLYARTGTGVQMITNHPKTGADSSYVIAPARHYATGALAGKAEGFITNGMDFRFSTDGFSTLLGQGDSGSALYGYDGSSWDLIGVASSTRCPAAEPGSTSSCIDSSYHLIDIDEIEKFKNLSEITITSNITSDGSKLLAGGVQLDSKVHDFTAHTKHPTLSVYKNRIASMGLNTHIIHAAENNYLNPEFASYNKNLNITAGTQMLLNANTDLGSSALNISAPEYSIDGAYTLIHAGLSIAPNSTVRYHALTEAGDNLHKVGAGKLIIDTHSHNAGGLRLGGGETELAAGTSFADIYLTNGASLKLNDSNPTNEMFANSIYLDNATLDLSGNSLEGSIKAQRGAKIINSSAKSATISIYNSADQVFHSSADGDISISNTLTGDFLYDGGLNISKLKATSSLAKMPTLVLQSSPDLHAYVSTSQAEQIKNYLDQDVETTPTNARDFSSSKSFNIANAELANTALDIIRAEANIANLSATNASVNIAPAYVMLDRKDGENINMNLGVGKYSAQVEKLAADPAKAALNSTVNLQNSTLAVHELGRFSGQITADSSSQLEFAGAHIDAIIDAASMQANNSHFVLGANSLNIHQNATGANNSYSIAPSLSAQESILLASLSGANAAPSEDYFHYAALEQSPFSSLQPNVKYAVSGNTATWTLEKIHAGDGAGEGDGAGAGDGGEVSPGDNPTLPGEPGKEPSTPGEQPGEQPEQPSEQPSTPAEPAPLPPLEPSIPGGEATSPGDQPTLPGEPVNPAEPGEATNPNIPGEAVQPSKPSDPDAPLFPDSPDTAPNQPGSPAEPETPSEELPGASDPAKPEAPAEPSVPAEPESPSEPSEPSNPSTPAEPDSPLFPDSPSVQPPVTAPEKPTTPDAPTAPSVPAEPSKPTAPEKPTTPTTPTEPQMDFDPANNPSNTETERFYKEYFFVKEKPQNTAQAHSALNQAFFSYVLEWNNMNKRMGDLRAERASSGVWAKTLAGESRYKGLSKSKFAELQAGFDERTCFDGGCNFTGFILTHAQYRPRSQVIESGNITSFGGGLYSSWLFDNGFYLDAVAKYIRYKNDFDINIQNGAQKSIALAAKNHTNSLIASIEIGKRFTYENFYLEPSAELISGHVGANIIQNTAHHVRLEQGAFTPLNAKLALAIGRSASEQNPFSYRFSAAYATDLARSGGVQIRDLNVIRSFDGQRDSRMILNASAGYKFSNDWMLNLELERSFFGDLQTPYLLNLTIRKGF